MEYIRVDEAPEKLKDNEMVIFKPNFMEEVIATKGKRGVNPVVSIRNIRDTMMLISEKYDSTVNPYHLKLQKYNNLVYEGNEGFADIILRVIKDNGLNLVDKVVEKQLLERDPKINKVFYVSPDIEGSTAFISLGFSMKNTKKVSKKEDVV